MDVIGAPADDLRENPVIFAVSGDVGPEFRLKFFGNGFAAVFGAEDNVDGVLRAGMGRRPRLPFFYIMCAAFPGPDKLSRTWFRVGNTRGISGQGRDAGVRTRDAGVAPTALWFLFADFPTASAVGYLMVQTGDMADRLDRGHS